MCDMKKAEVKPEEEPTNAVETLEQIADEWIEKQKSRSENAAAALSKKRISDCNVIRSFKNTMYKKRRFGDILKSFWLYIPKIAELIKEMWKGFVRSIEYVLKIERYEN
jgi:hypothetical protein